MHFMIKCDVNNVHMLTKEDTNQESAKSVANILEDEPSTAFDEIETIFDKSPSTPYMPNQSCINSKHTESDEFECSECTQTFLSESDLMAHLESKHNIGNGTSMKSVEKKATKK